MYIKIKDIMVKDIILGCRNKDEVDGLNECLKHLFNNIDITQNKYQYLSLREVIENLGLDQALRVLKHSRSHSGALRLYATHCVAEALQYLNLADKNRYTKILGILQKSKNYGDMGGLAAYKDLTELKKYFFHSVWEEDYNLHIKQTCLYLLSDDDFTLAPESASHAVFSSVYEQGGCVYTAQIAQHKYLGVCLDELMRMLDCVENGNEYNI
jgi:hypothetical protein